MYKKWVVIILASLWLYLHLQSLYRTWLEKDIINFYWDLIPLIGLSSFFLGFWLMIRVIENHQNWNSFEKLLLKLGQAFSESRVEMMMLSGFAVGGILLVISIVAKFICIATNCSSFLLTSTADYFYLAFVGLIGGAWFCSMYIVSYKRAFP